MNKANRAAQFAPFDALKGLQEALREKEEKHLRVQKAELSEEMAEEISAKLRKLEKGVNVKVTFYYKGHYVTLQGKVTEKSDVFKYLKIDSFKIYYDDLIEVGI